MRRGRRRDGGLRGGNPADGAPRGGSSTDGVPAGGKTGVARKRASPRAGTVRLLPALLAAALAALPTGPAEAQEREAREAGVRGTEGQESARRVDRREAVAPDAYIRVMVMRGEVRVRGWDRDSVAVTGSIDGAGDLFFSGGGAAAKLGLWEERAPSTTGRLEVRVPRRATLWVKTEEADVDVRAFDGTLDVISVTGRVRAEGEFRQLHLESMGGDVEVEAEVPVLGVRTAAGSIRVRGAVDDLNAGTVSGRIDVALPGLHRGRLESVTGDVRYRGDVRRGGLLDVQTHSGSVELAMPSDVDAEFTLHTIEGEVVNTLGETPERPSPGLRGPAVTFQLGDGGANVSVGTFSGTIDLAPAEEPASDEP